MKGKPPEIDFLSLYIKGDVHKWNHFLSVCLEYRDLPSLEKVLYGIQVGMDKLVKEKLNTDKVNLVFVRMQKSIEDTMKKILKLKNPNPLDNPFHKGTIAQTVAKKARDEQIERYLRRVRF